MTALITEAGKSWAMMFGLTPKLRSVPKDEKKEKRDGR